MIRHFKSNIVASLLRFSSSSAHTPAALRSTKPKAKAHTDRHFVDVHRVQTIAGRGGDGCVSFLQLWANETAGPDGGDGGNGGHVVFQASSQVNDLKNVGKIIKADAGIKGQNKDCNGKNAQHAIVKVPIGTVVRNSNSQVIADLEKEGMMFLAARGGAGGHGNHFFITDTQQAPEFAEYGAEGENLSYTLEVKCMADIGLIGFPNAGKSTLLRSVSRARPKVAAYPFTTLQPHLGIIQYTDLEQVVVADLPGLIPDSHKNRGLGIQFLKHAERCAGLLYVLDVSSEEPWQQYEILKYELSQFSEELVKRPHAIIANKMDLNEAEENLEVLKKKVDLPLIPISAKTGKNLTSLLNLIRQMYDERNSRRKPEN